MNQRDLSEIKRRLNPERRNPALLRGCYVAADGSIISDFVHAVGSLPLEENEKYMALFKRTLSGAAGQTLLPVDFSADQVMNSPEHQLLTRLVNDGLEDGEAANAFNQRVIGYIRSVSGAESQSVEELQNADNYLILLLFDRYDVPFRKESGEIDREQSDGVFSYVLCALCPVRQSKSALRYVAPDSAFHARESDWVVGMPEVGFMFPAFEERGANLYRALYYTRDSAEVHDGFLTDVFGAEPLMTAQEQKETFQSLLQESLGEDCSLDVVKAVHETVRDRIQEHKQDKTAEPLAFTPQEVSEVLKDCGVPPEKARTFQQEFSQRFGQDTALPAVNMVTPREFKLSTPGVKIKVDPEYSHLIETRVIDGKYYILVLADGDVEVNGVKITQG